MNSAPFALASSGPLHPWLRQIRMAFVPGPMTSLLEEVTHRLLQQVQLHGHQVQGFPDDTTDVILTTDSFGEAVDWRRALLLSARRRFNLSRTPAIYTMLHATPGQFRQLLEHFEDALGKDEPDPTDFEFPGLASQAYRTLYMQGHRGGPIMTLERLVQAQSKCIRVLLLVGDENPWAVYHFDLVGAHPVSLADRPEAFYDDIVLRIVTTVCSREVTEHVIMDDPIPYSVWQGLDTPRSMRRAAQELGKRGFFTEMVRINDLVSVPSVGDAVADQYSEGCFSTWDPRLDALIASVTGSARPLNKDNITEDDLAVIVGLRPDGRGAKVRHVQEKLNAPPSSESVEMMAIDRDLPRITVDWVSDSPAKAPVARSKLHGHRGIAVYDPRWVEYAPLTPPYFYYLVSCATDAQADGVQQAFARAETLRNPQDPRQVAFTILPGHGTVIVEKWVEGKVPFQVIWEYMDAGYLQVAKRIPQGPLQFVPGVRGEMTLEAEPVPGNEFAVAV